MNGVAWWVFERNYPCFRLFCHLLDCSMCQLVGFCLVSITRFTCQQIAVRLWVAVTKSGGIPWLIQQSSVLMSAKTLLTHVRFCTGRGYAGDQNFFMIP